MFSPFVQIQLFTLAVLAVLGATSYFVVTGMAHDIGVKATRISELERQIAMKDAKLFAEAGRIERRDAAIKQSKCADTINGWIRKPSTLPEPFDPFNQLKKLRAMK